MTTHRIPGRGRVDHARPVSFSVDGTTIEGRAGDTERGSRHRRAGYAAQAARHLELFSARGKLVTVDGLGTVDGVADRIASGLDAKLGR